MSMTPKQDKFCELVVSLSNKTEAYKQTYNTSNMLDKTINEKASRLAAEDKVSTRIEELRAEAKEEHGIDRAFILKGYLEIISDVDYTFKLGKDNNLTKEDSKAFYRIMQQTKNTDKLRALESISKMLGLNAPEEISHTHTLKTYKTNWS